jgi:ubiquinone/menaquinone biosynthesis C-methylase UbiE
MGVDLLATMIDQSRERAQAEGAQDRVESRVADARRLSFEDNLFDAVIMQSVNVFFDDKSQAMRECVRGARPGGYVGMTEVTWLKPRSPELEDTFRRMVYAQALQQQVEGEEQWRKLGSSALATWGWA